MKHPKPIKRLGSSIWYLRQHVPRRYQSIEPPAQGWISLQTDSKAIAKAKASMVWQQQIAASEARLAGAEALDLFRFHAAPSARLGHFPFESDGAFPSQC